MPPMGFGWLALVLVAVSSLAYSAVDLLRKLLVGGMRPLPLLFFMSAGQVPFFLAWWIVAPGTVSPGYLLPAAGSLLLNIAANVLYLEAIRLSPLSLTVPFLSLTPVFTAALAVPALGEVPRSGQALGIVLVVIGAFALNLQHGAAATPGAAWRAFRNERGSVLMTLVALLWSGASPLDKLAMLHASVPFHALVLNGGIAVAVAIVLIGRRRTAELAAPASARPALLLTVLASVVGLAFILVAVTIAWVGMVETLKRAAGSVLALLIGRRFFGEPLTLPKLIGVALMVAGVGAILL
jgi:drug/metabolite transporter (DMT)-like permease